MGGATPRWRDVLAMAQRAEAVGFDSLWVVDHLLMRFGGKHERISPDEQPAGMWEGWSLLAALAAATTRVELGTLVVCTAFRNPALLAKMADTVDEISGGRLILGLGAGWHEHEFRAVGYPFDHRVSRFEEALTIIRLLLREGSVDFDGRYYQARECELRPRGPRPAGPPLLIGSTRERMLRLAVTHADYWNAWLVWDRSYPDAVPPLRTVVDAACAEVGRDPETLQRTVTVRVDVRGSQARVQGSAEPLTGSPDQLAEAILSFAGEGISHLQVMLSPNRLASLEAFAPVLGRLR